LLKTGKLYPVQASKHLAPSNVISPSTAKSCKDSANSVVSSAGGTRSHSCSPKNGIKDSVSARVLASELDSLDCDGDRSASQKGTKDRTNLRLDFNVTPHDNKTEDEKLKPQNLSLNACPELDSEWLLLDCSYGVPLFDAEVNREVCDRIVSQGLCSKDRYDMIIAFFIVACLQD